ncbi:MAG TPA: PDZ domain-containing protein [Candidatus Acidoferrales bacterium]|nr:PDZ domain-containing protein [Candidatus Acidoferrales bacterium]
MLVAITMFVIVVFYVPLGHADYAGEWRGGTYGVQATRAFDGGVASVAPGSPAQRAGVRPGDRLVIAPFSKDFPAFVFPRAGDRGTFTLRRPGGSIYRVTMTAVAYASFSRVEQLLGIFAILPATIFIAIAFALVFLRPNVMTWSFYAYAIGFLSTQPSLAFYQAYLSAAGFTALSLVLNAFFGNNAVLPLLPFVLRFPDDRLTGVSRVFDRGVWIAIALGVLVYSYDWYEWEHGVFTIWGGVLDTWLPLAVFVLATGVLIRKYQHATPQVQPRFGFLVAGLIVSFVAYAIYFLPVVPRPIAEVAGFAVVIMPVSVMYAVLKHRVLDINFVLNRALVYSLLSIFVVAFVSLLDWFAGHVISGWRFTSSVELLLTVAVGFLLDRVNRFISNVVEAVFLRAPRRRAIRAPRGSRASLRDRRAGRERRPGSNTRRRAAFERRCALPPIGRRKPLRGDRDVDECGVGAAGLRSQSPPGAYIGIGRRARVARRAAWPPRSRAS